MHINYNFRRILLLLRADWMEYKKSYLLGMGVLFLVWMLFLYLINVKGTNSDTPVVYWVIGMFVALLSFCQHAARKMHRQKAAYLMLPAANSEKYTCLLLEALAYFVGFQLVFWVGYWIWKPFTPALDFPSLLAINAKLDGWESVVIFLSTLLFLSYMSFRRYAFLILVGGLAVYGFLFVCLVAQFVSVSDFSQANLELLCFNKAFIFLTDWFTPAMIASSLVVMYVAYLKLKEKEVR
ncbi:MAG: hypothetical protein LBQ65_03290 [Tannerellaceae bacterium]|jgi:hypothetical protein|nr:hypothetical protein [Tannerellaceae bacterium]